MANCTANTTLTIIHLPTAHLSGTTLPLSSTANKDAITTAATYGIDSKTPPRSPTAKKATMPPPFTEIRY